MIKILHSSMYPCFQTSALILSAGSLINFSIVFYLKNYAILYTNKLKSNKLIN